MTRDREVKLGDLDELPVDEPRAGGVAGQAAAAKKKGKGAPSGNQPPPAPPKKRQRAKGGGGSGLLWLLLLVVLALLAFLFYQQTRMQEALAVSRAESRELLDSLEAQLSATGDSLSESSSKLLSTVRKHGEDIATSQDEIRKLWDVSNKRNRGWIEDNRKALAQLSAQVESERKELQALKGVESRLSGRLDSQKKELQSAVSAANQGAQQSQQRVAQLQTQLDVLSETVKQLQAENRTLRNTVGKLQSDQGSASNAQLQEIEEAIRAFDTYRLQVNNRLDRLESR